MSINKKPAFVSYVVTYKNSSNHRALFYKYILLVFTEDLTPFLLDFRAIKKTLFSE